MGRGSVEQRLIGAVCCAALGAFWSMLSTLRAAILSTNIVMAHILTAPGGRSASAWGRAEPTLLFLYGPYSYGVDRYGSWLILDLHN